MTVPDFQSLMLPLLKFLGDKQEHSLREAIESLADDFNLSEEDRKELLPSGQQSIFHNRVGWARTYMKKAGLVESTKRGYFKIAPRGLEVLGQNLQRVDVKFLNQYPEFVEFHTAKRKEKAGAEPDEKPALESLEDNYEQIKQDLIQELVVQIKECSPDFFERLVVDLLIRMGYGGSREDAGKAIGGSGDAGIDGVINEDRLGLDSIYIQAKRWKEETTVSRPEIQKFAGALLGRKAKKGVFITTSKFSKEAIDYAGGLENKIVLIDGEQLAEYMIDFNVGVTRIASYEIRRVDLDYFIDE
jgi:restriction system protein